MASESISGCPFKQIWNASVAPVYKPGHKEAEFFALASHEHDNIIKLLGVVLDGPERSMLVLELAEVSACNNESRPAP